MKLETNEGTYEQYDLQKLNDNDLETFWRIIQDSWSFFFGEYTKCSATTCGNVASKKDIYEKFTSQYRDYTIEELEKKFMHDFVCKVDGCGCTTERIWGESFIAELEQSLKKNIYANLITYKNKANEIIGLGYSYINTLRTIYQSDLYFDFPEENFSSDYFQLKMNDPHIIPTGLSIIERDKYFPTVANIWTLLLKSSASEYNNLPGVFAALHGSKTYDFFISNGANDHGMTNYSSRDVRLLQHNNMIQEYKKTISLILP